MNKWYLEMMKLIREIRSKALDVQAILRTQERAPADAINRRRVIISVSRSVHLFFDLVTFAGAKMERDRSFDTPKMLTDYCLSWRVVVIALQSARP